MEERECFTIILIIIIMKIMKNNNENHQSLVKKTKLDDYGPH